MRNGVVWHTISNGMDSSHSLLILKCVGACVMPVLEWMCLNCPCSCLTPSVPHIHTHTCSNPLLWSHLHVIMCRTNVYLQTKQHTWTNIKITISSWVCALMRKHTHKCLSHINTLSSCSGKLPGSHARLYGYGSHGEREWAICGVLLTGPKESRPKLRWGLKEERSAVSLGSRPETSICSLLCLSLSLWSAVEPHSRWFVCRTHFAQELRFTLDHRGERKKW